MSTFIKAGFIGSVKCLEPAKAGDKRRRVAFLMACIVKRRSTSRAEHGPS